MELRHAAQRAPAEPQPEPAPGLLVGGNEPSVFVDDSGRRARGVRLLGSAMAGLCALWLAGLVIGVAGFSSFPSAQSPISGLATLARVHVAEAMVSQVEGREASPSRGWRERAVDTGGDRARSVCLADGVGARLDLAAGRSGYGAGQKGTARAACSIRTLAALHRDDSRLT